MIVTYYLYKGPKNSLVGPWVLAACNPREDNAELEAAIPPVSQIYNHRENLFQYNPAFKHARMDSIIIETKEINEDGDMAVLNAKKRLLSMCKVRGRVGDCPVYIKQIKNPKTWYERFTVMYAVFIRREYLKRLTPNYQELDDNYEHHLEILTKYKHLPQQYIWEKAMSAVADIYPKPAWYQRELNAVEEALKE